METYLSEADLDPTKVEIFKKTIKHQRTEKDIQDGIESFSEHRKICLIANGITPLMFGEKCHCYCDFNKFTLETCGKPSKEDGWVNVLDNDSSEDSSEEENQETKKERKLKWHYNYIKKNICDPTAKYYTASEETIFSKHPNCKMYKTKDNGQEPFVVFINNEEEEVYIYGITHDVILEKYHDDPNLYNRLITKFRPLKIFIGKSELNNMTNFSGGHGNRWDGNSILLRIGDNSKFKYVHIGICIYEFETEEEITSYVSSVGNNCVPYPYAESKNWCYCMSEMKKTPVSDHPNRIQEGDISYVNKAKYEPFEYTTICNR
ncbi:MAG: hypothetical protein H0X03_08225, partial [Nitrosopumilus sp.]|nr:hypothetical protein [Nitrosopumilus sp.]